MSVYDKLFGSPEKAAESLKRSLLDVQDFCNLVDNRCDICPYDPGPFGCSRWFEGDDGNWSAGEWVLKWLEWEV